MQITIPNVSDKLTYCVIVALGIDVLATVLLAGLGLVLPGLVALALAGAIYWFVYRNLAGNTATARLAAAIIAILHVFFAVTALATRNPFGFIMDGIVAACLGYVFLQLRQPAHL